MKGFNKLVLATAITAASSCSFAMQAMDDESLSAATGQDGITIRLDSSMTDLGIKWIDRDGIVGDAVFGNSGAVSITPIGVVTTDLKIDIDAGGNAGTGAGTDGQLRINVFAGGVTKILLHDGVAGAGTVGTVVGVADAGATGSTIGAITPIISFDKTSELTIDAGMTMQIQLGKRAAGSHFLTASANLAGVTLNAMSIADAVGGGSIGLGVISLGNIVSNTAIDVVSAANAPVGYGAGLKIDTTGTSIGSIGFENIQLGAPDFVTGTGRNNAIGDVYISNLSASNVIYVTGH